MSIIIGISGFAGHGKDTFATYMMECIPKEYTVKRYAFADALKEELYDLLIDSRDPVWKSISHPGFPASDQIPNSKLDYINLHKPVFRETLQLLGEFRRQQNPFYWIRKVNKKICEDKPKIAIITDLRYQNEYFFVKSNDGVTIRVERVGYSNPHNVNYNHISETDLLSYKFDIEVSCMDGDLEALRQSAVTAFDIIKWNVSSDDFNSKAFSGMHVMEVNG